MSDIKGSSLVILFWGCLVTAALLVLYPMWVPTVLPQKLTIYCFALSSLGFALKLDPTGTVSRAIDAIADWGDPVELVGMVIFVAALVVCLVAIIASLGFCLYSLIIWSWWMPDWIGPTIFVAVCVAFIALMFASVAGYK